MLIADVRTLWSWLSNDDFASSCLHHSDESSPRDKADRQFLDLHNSNSLNLKHSSSLFLAYCRLPLQPPHSGLSNDHHAGISPSFSYSFFDSAFISQTTPNTGPPPFSKNFGSGSPLKNMVYLRWYSSIFIGAYSSHDSGSIDHSSSISGIFRRAYRPLVNVYRSNAGGSSSLVQLSVKERWRFEYRNDNGLVHRGFREDSLLCFNGI